MQYCKFIYCLSTLLANYSLLVDFVTYRHIEKPLKNLIIFQNGKFPTDGIELELAKRLQIPQLLVANEVSADLQKLIRIPALTLVFVTQLDETRTLARVSRSSQRLPQTPLIFVCKTVPNSLEMWNFFVYFHQQNILNVLLLYRVYEKMRVHTMAPYPELRIVELDTRNLSSFIQPKHQNVWGYRFFVSAFNDPPLTCQHEVDNRTELCGLTAYVFQAFLKLINGTITVINHPPNETMKRRVDMMANFLFRVDLIDNTSVASYPLFQTQICLMLPVESEIPLSWYLWYAFDYCTRMTLCFIILAIISLGIIIHRENCRRADIGLYFLLLFRLFLAQAVPLQRFRTAKKSIFLLYFCALFMVLTNIYAASLTALLSTRAQMPAVRTPEDLLRTPLKIILPAPARQIYFESGLLPRSLMPRLYEVDYHTYLEHRIRRNTSYAYIMSRDKWLLFEKQQKRLGHAVFRMTTGRLCTPIMLQVLSLQQHSPFQGILQLLFLELQQFGMVGHWLSEVPPIGKFNLRNETDTGAVPLSLQHFAWGFFVLGVGWSFALLAFLGEWVIWKRRDISNRVRFWWLRLVGRWKTVHDIEVGKPRTRKQRAQKFRE